MTPKQKQAVIKKYRSLERDHDTHWNKYRWGKPWRKHGQLEQLFAIVVREKLLGEVQLLRALNK